MLLKTKFEISNPGSFSSHSAALAHSPKKIRRELSQAQKRNENAETEMKIYFNNLNTPRLWF